MAKSTIPNEWLQPLVAEKVAELRNVEDETEYEPQRNHFFISVDGTDYTCKELVHIVRSYYKARDTLLRIANCKPIIECGYPEILQRARETLEEIENDRQS